MSNEVAASLAAAQEDIARIFKDYEVPAAYRSRLTAYIQAWYLDQGRCESGVCALRPPIPAMPTADDAGA